jgi:hypothetical protein
MKVKGKLIHPIVGANFEVDRKMGVGDCFACDGARWEITAVYGTRKGSRIRQVGAWQVEGDVGGLPTGTRIPDDATLTADGRERQEAHWGYLGYSRDARLPKNLRGGK